MQHSHYETTWFSFRAMIMILSWLTAGIFFFFFFCQIYNPGQNNNAKAFILGFCIFFSLLLSDWFISASLVLPSPLSPGFCVSWTQLYFILTALLRHGTVIPPHPAVSSVLHNKRPPFRDYTVQDVVDSKQQGLPFTLLVCLPYNVSSIWTQGQLEPF